MEYIVIDGSDNSSVREYLIINGAGINWISEPDEGIYDAMNKALSRAVGDYIVFINAGDVIHPNFDPKHFFHLARATDEIILGSVVEVAGKQRYLCPGTGHEELVFDAPRHQATFYPRKYYSLTKYAIEKKIGADGFYTRSGIAAHGAVFVPMAVSEFYVGGVSSTYSNWRTVRQRLVEAGSFVSQTKIIVKAGLWRLLPRGLFYRLLASYKYTRLSPGQELQCSSRVIRRPAA